MWLEHLHAELEWELIEGSSGSGVINNACCSKGQLYIPSPDPSHLNMAIASMYYHSGTCSLLFTESTTGYNGTCL